MIDMGFAPQLVSILDHIGGSLKSENETEAYEQGKVNLEQLKTIATDTNTTAATTTTFSTTFELPKHRITPMEVEQMAKRYLRHPAVISVGDRDSGKNSRIVQNIFFLSIPSKKEQALRRLVLDPRFMRERSLSLSLSTEGDIPMGSGVLWKGVGDGVSCLHGGKSQDEREQNLQMFRQGGVVLVATDVAGRGFGYFQYRTRHQL